MSVSTSDDDGVIGYQVTTVTPANSAPSAQAALPSTMILPRVASMRRTENGSRFSSAAACSKPGARGGDVQVARLRLRRRTASPMAASTSASSMESRRASTPTYAMLRRSLRSFGSPRDRLDERVEGDRVEDEVAAQLRRAPSGAS